MHYLKVEYIFKEIVEIKRKKLDRLAQIYGNLYEYL